MPAEKFFPLAEAAKQFPSPPSRATIDRWIFSGVRGVKLESQIFGGRRYVSLEAIERFLARLNPAEHQVSA